MKLKTVGLLHAANKEPPVSLQEALAMKYRLHGISARQK
jgi:hypothetical protein